jgi:proteasome beta subunit
MLDPERWKQTFFDYSTSSFAEILHRAAPHLLPGRSESGTDEGTVPAVPHGTTVLALRYRDGVIMAGDRQASEGYQVAHRRIEKIFKSDDLSGVGIAGAAGPAMEMARLFQTELEHYEKVEGENLSLDGKANKLGQMIRKYDVTGGRYEETDYFAQGSGGKDARDSLKKRFRRDMNREEALRVAIEALIDAADEDLGTGGPDLLRGILPSVKTITRSGFAEAPEDEIRRHCEAVLNDRNRL